MWLFGGNDVFRLKGGKVSFDAYYGYYDLMGDMKTFMAICDLWEIRYYVEKLCYDIVIAC